MYVVCTCKMDTCYPNTKSPRNPGTISVYSYVYVHVRWIAHYPGILSIPGILEPSQYTPSVCTCTMDTTLSWNTKYPGNPGTMLVYSYGHVQWIHVHVLVI